MTSEQLGRIQGIGEKDYYYNKLQIAVLPVAFTILYIALSWFALFTAPENSTVRLFFWIGTAGWLALLVLAVPPLFTNEPKLRISEEGIWIKGKGLFSWESINAVRVIYRGAKMIRALLEIEFSNNKREAYDISALQDSQSIVRIIQQINSSSS